MSDMMIPFVMLLIITIALILERKHYEDKVVDIYETKFKQWKQHSSHNQSKQKECKELVGLVFLKNEKLYIELLDAKVQDKLERKKYIVLNYLKKA